MQTRALKDVIRNEGTKPIRAIVTVLSTFENGNGGLELFTGRII